ncbi:MAG TPA: mechanosensitive ion channel domain-containing protein [Candidatus Krumholzibacteriaceae bacterium]|nr:mechanosensitive ion channel domain-containing protein [Candidatus Krumholzibacteriaceae bacterium]
MESSSVYLEKGVELIMSYGPKLILAILVLIIGLRIIKVLTRLTNKTMGKRDYDKSLTIFLLRLISISLKTVLFISVISMVGVKTTSFIAILGAAGLAVGFALQGSLSNFAGGVMILLFKPFKVGDVIETQGYTGKVTEISIFHTILKTFDNKTIITPNSGVSGGSIINYTKEPTRRIDMTFSIGYDDDIGKAKNILKKIVEEDDRILSDPAPMIVVSEHGDSSINLFVRPWCNTENYWNIYFDMHEKVKIAFDESGITIPYPQQDVHIYNDKEQNQP